MKEQEQKKHRSGRRLFKGLLFLAACGLVMAIVVYTPIFTLQRVEVSGTSYLTKEQICENGRIHTGEPLFQLQTDDVAQNLMHDLRIESAVVRRRLPDRLEIEVVERKPVATVACDYGYLDLGRSGVAVDRQFAGDLDLDPVNLAQCGECGLNQRDGVPPAGHTGGERRLVHMQGGQSVQRLGG